MALFPFNPFQCAHPPSIPAGVLLLVIRITFLSDLLFLTLSNVDERDMLLICETDSRPDVSPTSKDLWTLRIGKTYP